MGNPRISKNNDEFYSINIPKTIIIKIKNNENKFFSDSFDTDPRNAESQLDLKDLLEKFPDVTMERVFSSTQQNLDKLSENSDNEKKQNIDLLSFYRIEIPHGENTDNILDKLKKIILLKKHM
jgi:cell division protein FtsX